MHRLPVIRHLTSKQIAHKYRACRDPGEKTRWHAIWLLSRPDHPRSPAQAAEATGLSDVWVRRLLKRWNECGPAGLADRRAGNGNKPRLPEARQAELSAALRGRPPDGGLWTGPKVARYVRDRWGVELGPVSGWKWLRRLGLTLQLPRPRHPRAATAAEQRAWKRRAAAARAAPAGAPPG
jgi:transposase